MLIQFYAKRFLCCYDEKRCQRSFTVEPDFYENARIWDRPIHYVPTQEIIPVKNAEYFSISSAERRVVPSDILVWGSAECYSVTS